MRTVWVERLRLRPNWNGFKKKYERNFKKQVDTIVSKSFPSKGEDNKSRQ